ncbi:prolyl oligopeptidase family serine peptidase, partial [Pelomonas sp. KK5]|uniref:prolyl oligopeptidase family serine peptidase n=1 Tax=Pelomonas sp. KK5 TaxID=1855730 RepID=UPI00117FCE63
GSLLALPLPGRDDPVEPIFVPTPHEAVDAVFHLAVAGDALWFGVMDDVNGRLYRSRRTPQGWQRQAQPLPPHAAVRLLTGEAAPSAVLVKTESLLEPPETTVRNGRTEAIARGHAAFDARPFLTEQRFATSRDGTRVPYYLVRRRDLKPDGSAAALLSGYGGFGVSSLPAYLNSEFHTDLAEPLLRHGAVFVQAHIRGGGEYGPAWHQAAQGRLHQHGIDDLIAVAEDLGRSGWADPRRLAFVGASNGGLLATAAGVQRPELWRAIVADVPLTDMLRYHELFTGAVWIDEYGDPRKDEDRAALLGWSPLQNLREGVRYPAMLLTTSSSDDRVHPGHARRFAEGLRKLGQPVLFRESTDSGHGGAASRESVAGLRALQTVFLERELGLR